ncbi:replication factor a 1 [Loa loa]|uniref:Replication factor a 1 n=1 Tax=Loa loa TaxID=7209 RepID=A0A1S0UKD4_LOALO|nr:replication factor a 1 [Loa loa]EJD75993.1 replication factor a 1 [Loa loa]
MEKYVEGLWARVRVRCMLAHISSYLILLYVCANYSLWSSRRVYAICNPFEMSTGFVTASGKGVTVSEKALQKARQLFELLDDSNDDSSIRTAAGNIDSARCSSMESGAARRNSRQVSSTFKSPLIKNPRLDNVSYSSSFNSAIKEIAAISEQSIPTTPKNSLCSKIGNVTPIKLLTPYCKNWRLCIKVTSVDEIRCIRGQHIFSFLAVDDGGVEIRVSAFGDIACRTATLICPEQMYYITRASVKMANRRYSRNEHDMEVVLRPDSEVTKCTDRPYILSPKVNFEFVRIHNLQNFIDTEIEELQKREIQVVDDSGYYVAINLWGQKAKMFPNEQYQHVLAVKRLLVRCFQGTISLVSLASSKLLHDPHFPEADALRFWYSENRKSFKPASMNQVSSFHEHKWIKQLKPSLDGHFFNLTAMISSIFTENAVYKGCPTCKKKLLVEKDNDLYICSKCGICNEYKYYYTLHMELFDFTGTVHVTAFDDCAQKLIGEQADEVAKFLKFDSERYQSSFKSVLFKPYMFRLGAQKSGNADYSTISTKTKQIYFWSMKDLIPMPFDNYCTFLQRAIEHANTGISVEK